MKRSARVALWVNVPFLLSMSLSFPAYGVEVEDAPGTWLAAMEMPSPEEPMFPSLKKIKPEPASWEKPVPLRFYLDYTYVTDYIDRGVNCSDGPNRCNNQMTVGIEADLDDFGAVGFSAWFEWYAGQQAMDPDSHGNLQEVDYTVYWIYDIPYTPVTVEIGWGAYMMPQAKGDDYYTHELYVSIGLDDSFLFGTENPVLNPYVACYVDMDDVPGSWLELGISHDFAFADMGMAEMPILKDLTWTPSMVLGFDCHQFSESFRMQNIVYGMDLSYDVSGALGIPEQYGRLAVTGFMYYSQAINRNVINDELWGGVSVGYEW